MSDKPNTGEAGELPETVGRGSKLGTLKEFKQRLRETCARRRLRGRKFNPHGEPLGTPREGTRPTMRKDAP